MVSMTSTLITCSTLFALLLLSPTFVANAHKQLRDVWQPSAEFVIRFQLLHDVCVEKTGATEEAIKEFSSGEVHEDPALKCYMNCLFHELNIVDDDGEMHYEKLRRFVPDEVKELVKRFIDGCESHVPTGVSQCDRAWSWHVCWKEFDPEHYFLP